jgi:hypothetical protein
MERTKVREPKIAPAAGPGTAPPVAPPSDDVTPLQMLIGTERYREATRESFEQSMEEIAKLLESSSALLWNQGGKINNGEEITAHLSWALSELLDQQAAEVRRLHKSAMGLLKPPSNIMPPAEVSLRHGRS